MLVRKFHCLIRKEIYCLFDTILIVFDTILIVSEQDYSNLERLIDKLSNTCDKELNEILKPKCNKYFKDFEELGTSSLDNQRSKFLLVCYMLANASNDGVMKDEKEKLEEQRAILKTAFNKITFKKLEDAECMLEIRKTYKYTDIICECLRTSISECHISNEIDSIIHESNVLCNYIKVSEGSLRHSSCDINSDTFSESSEQEYQSKEIDEQRLEAIVKRIKSVCKKIDELDKKDDKTLLNIFLYPEDKNRIAGAKKMIGLVNAIGRLNEKFGSYNALTKLFYWCTQFISKYSKKRLEQIRDMESIENKAGKMVEITIPIKPSQGIKF